MVLRTNVGLVLVELDQQGHGDPGGITVSPAISVTQPMTASIRRFSRFPSSLRLSDRGRVYPYPTAVTREGAIWRLSTR